ncbi:hypothetical protein GCM10022217_11370 [Chryseobacterium ginsenosidimutans]|jgi:hypothetical protein|uniref:hypothetical protein n=1 Tax=Chryseobacterium TaxID=59732 RepID=UPI000AC5C798|nr:hypothetical protein [Chryseobacterium aquaticum]
MSDIKEKQTNYVIVFEDESLLDNVWFAMERIGRSWNLRINTAIAIGNKRFTLQE